MRAAADDKNTHFVLCASDPGFFVFESNAQGRLIDLKKFAAFITSHVKPSVGFLPLSEPSDRLIIQKIAHGKLDLWDMEDSRTKWARMKIRRKFSFCPTSNHLVERQNKYQNFSSLNHRGEASASVRMIASGCLKERDK